MIHYWKNTAINNTDMNIHITKGSFFYLLPNDSYEIVTFQYFINVMLAIMLQQPLGIWHLSLLRWLLFQETRQL